MNSYFMLSDLRDNVGEGTESHWDDAELMRKLNAANLEIGFLVSQTTGDWLMKSDDLTPVASVITLPSDCAKPVYMEEKSTGREIPFEDTLRERRVSRASPTGPYGGYISAYMVGDTIEVNQDSYTTEVTLWYERRLIDLSAGTIAAGASTSLQFKAANEPNGADDYYNGVTVECMNATTKAVKLISTISDYAGSTYTATVVGTPVTSDFYGTVPQIPREGHALIVLKATLAVIAKPSSAFDPKVFDNFEKIVKRAEKAFEDWIATRVKNSQGVRTTEILG
ncbi:hypothetical protein LCGC14_1232920 [marine sediment metagenome]|uniref:Uncharacterized protein n=1 Tax=marine sediment metagenome TaxID=412755 RepID=A0A0F9NQ79_9ZZZZ